MVRLADSGMVQAGRRRHGRRELGHEVRPLGVADELGPIRTVIHDWEPHIVFNLLEEFLGRQDFDHHVVSFLELMQVAYTGCHPRGMMLARDKALSKKLAAMGMEPLGA